MIIIISMKTILERFISDIQLKFPSVSNVVPSNIKFISYSDNLHPGFSLQVFCPYSIHFVIIPGQHKTRQLPSLSNKSFLSYLHYDYYNILMLTLAKLTLITTNATLIFDCSDDF